MSLSAFRNFSVSNSIRLLSNRIIATSHLSSCKRVVSSSSTLLNSNRIIRSAAAAVPSAHRSFSSSSRSNDDNEDDSPSGDNAGSTDDSSDNPFEPVITINTDEIDLGVHVDHIPTDPVPANEWGLEWFRPERLRRQYNPPPMPTTIPFLATTNRPHFPGQFFFVDPSNSFMEAFKSGKMKYVALFSPRNEKQEKEEQLLDNENELQSTHINTASDSTTDTTAVSSTCTSASTSLSPLPSATPVSDSPDSSASPSICSSTEIVLPTVSRSNTTLPNPSSYHPVGMFATFHSFHRSGILFVIQRRISLTNFTSRDGMTMAKVKHHEDAPMEDVVVTDEMVELKNKILHLLAKIKRSEGDDFRFRMRNFFYWDAAYPGFIVDYWAILAFLCSSHYYVRKYVDTIDLTERMKLVLKALERDMQIVDRQSLIAAHARMTLDAQRKQFLLKEKEKINAGLGDSNALKDSQVQMYKERLKDKTVPAEVQTIIEEELNKLRNADGESSDVHMTRTYIEWLTNIPWGVYSEDRFDIQNAEQILNEDHFGLEDVKSRILEFIATGRLLGTIPSGKIICLVGPPGTRKTSIGKSIARSLNRAFYRISVGGLDDVSELKGHRRTYVGALPGKLIQALKQSKTQNPVILIDEIDKLGRTYRGDPSAAMLEILDPEQNSSFVDHYLDLPVDLSKVLFICTANDASTIPGPLADRMDFINIAGYVLQEKIQIVNKYLEPAVREKTGINPEQLQLTESAIAHLIRWYCRESGVRNLQKQLDKIYRKAALKIARSSESIDGVPANPLQLPIVITPDNLAEYVGKPVYSTDRLYEINPVGVSTGLAWTSNGGVIIFIECTVADQPVKVPEKQQVSNDKEKKKGRRKRAEEEENEEEEEEKQFSVEGSGRGSLFCTGQLGEVMKESSSIAYTVAKRQLSSLAPYSRFFIDSRIHVHLPAGAIPKDGPSAGITMVCALLSLALNRAMKPDLAMTGELTLTGKVLPIGGVKEKLMAAKSANLREIIVPYDNKKDVDEVQSFIKDGLTIHFVQTYEQVFKIAFPDFKTQQETEAEAQLNSTDSGAGAGAAAPVSKSKSSRGSGTGTGTGRSRSSRKKSDSDSSDSPVSSVPIVPVVDPPSRPAAGLAPKTAAVNATTIEFRSHN